MAISFRMSFRFAACVFRSFFVLVAFLGNLAGLSAAWDVSGAKICYNLTLEKRPTHSACGFFVHLPDGGIHGSKLPQPVVVADDGRTLQSRVLWNSPEGGFDLVFESPGDSVQSVRVYMKDSGKPEYWTPDCGLKPSPVLVSVAGQDSLSAAESLMKFDKPVKSLLTSLHYGGEHSKGKKRTAAFNIGGDVFGRSMPGIFYYLTYIDAPSSGSYWFGPKFPHTPVGQTKILVNGREIARETRSPLWGGTGGEAELQQGLNRVEVIQTAPGSGPYKQFLMYLTWRPPGETMEIESSYSRVINGKEVAHSGIAKLDSIERADGGPVAAPSVNNGLLFWTGEEQPLVTAELIASVGKNPPDTTYTWTFSDNSTASGERVSWIFPGLQVVSATLTAKSSKGVSKSTFEFYPSPFEAADLNKLANQLAYQAAVDFMVSESPTSRDAIPQWTTEHWNNFFRTLGGSTEGKILAKLFKKHSATMARQLSPEQYLWLQDRFVDTLGDGDPGEALRWIDAIRKSTKTPDRLQTLKLCEAEILLRSQGDVAKAKAILEPLAATNNSATAKALIRLGDIAFQQGDLNDATSKYSRAQAVARASRNASQPAASTYQLSYEKVLSDAPAVEPKPKAAAGFAEILKAREEAKGRKKAAALQEVSLSENVRMLTKNGLYREAGEALEVWEAQFPLSKVGGDYILREAEWNIANGKHDRAYPMLAAYCTLIDASSFLPDATTLLIKCSAELPDTKAPTRVIVKSILDRMKYHPVAASLEEYLNQP